MAGAPLDAPEFQRWREEADRAISVAGSHATGPAVNWACFLAEQAAQLAVKGLLHGCGAPAWGHDLVTLGQAARATVGTSWPSSLDPRCARLSRHYITSRYPDASPSGSPAQHYTSVDASQALEDAGALLAAVDAAWRELNAT
jgi:HEPN domain-containing protein